MLTPQTKFYCVAQDLARSGCDLIFQSKVGEDVEYVIEVAKDWLQDRTMDEINDELFIVEVKVLKKLTRKHVKARVKIE